MQDILPSGRKPSNAENATSEKVKNYIVEKVFETKVQNNSGKEGMKEISEGLRKVLLELDDIRKQQSPGILILGYH